MIYRRLAILSVGAVVLLAATATAPALAVEPTAAGQVAASACPDGALPLVNTGKKIMPGGSTAYAYRLPNGQTFKQIAPPLAFNPATASPGLLNELGLPPRPTTAKNQASWRDEIQPFVKNGIGGGVLCEAAGADESAGPAGPAMSAALAPMSSVGHTGHTFWSGYETRSGPYQKAVGHFTQPLVSNTSNSAMANWIGLNGTGSGGRLIQAGTVNDVGSPTLGTPVWELFCSAGSSAGCNAQVEAPAYKANPGDDVSISVSYNPATLISYYQVAINGTLRVNIQFQMKSGSNSGNVAQFITERYLSPLRNIPDFGVVNFSSSRTYPCWDDNCNDVFIGAQNYFAYEMTNNGSFVSPACGTAHLLVYPAGISGGNFANHFCSRS